MRYFGKLNFHTRPRNKSGVTAGFILLFALNLTARTYIGEARSKVYLNGVATPVYFNDGDSFRVLAGPLEGTRARIAGFNTLESYGPVHKWGDWTKKELYIFAKMATLNAQRGVWHCKSKMEKDTYGRILWHCDDLAISQISQGYAHAMTIDQNPAAKFLLQAQKKAQKGKKGFWAKGIPNFILTSAHSIDEKVFKSSKTYDRFVSALDGHSEKVTHSKDYKTCTEVCYDPLSKYSSDSSKQSCISYVNFKNRYGANKPDCLKVN